MFNMADDLFLVYVCAFLYVFYPCLIVRIVNPNP